MATTAAFGSLSVPAPDDTMEVSSPANRNLDDDIDIDFEDYQGGVQLIDDERMLEDADATRPTTATDDIMEDDPLPGEQHQADEEIMRDDIPPIQEVQQQEDEELIDYGEDEFQEAVIDDTMLPAPEQPAEIEEIGFDHIDEEVPAVVEDTTTDASITILPEDVLTEQAAEGEPAAAATEHGDTPSAEAPLDDHAYIEEPNFLAEGPDAHVIAEGDVTESLTQPSSQENNNVSFLPPLDTAISTTADTPGTPTDTGLHPMTVRYGDHFLPLFKSQRQPDGLLKDDNLANLSLAELITNCRQRLALKVGETISEDQELVLAFDRMGLVLVEDCRAAFETSLHDVLQVYLQLHENDDADEIPPLSLTLTMQLRFQSSFAILKQAAAGGQGMSSFTFLQSTAGQHEDSHPEEYQDAGYGEHDAHDGFEGHDYGNVEYANDEEQTQPGIEGQHQELYEQAGEDGGTDHEEYYQEGEYTNHPGEDEYYPPEQSEAAAQLDDLEADDSYTKEAPVNTLEDQEVAAHDLNAAEQTTVSTASSTTFQGESANNSAEQDANTQEDFSTFLTEHDEGDTKKHSPDDGGTAIADGPHLEGKATSAPEGENLFSSEDFLNESAGGKYEDEAYGEEHAAGVHGDECNFDQADTYDEQHDGNHPDYQPDEEDEQFHTAHDLLNADEYEHDPEDDVYGDDGDNLDDTVGTVIHHETAKDQGYDQQVDFDDEIGFDDDDDGDLQDGATPAKSGSPSGKRSFDELEDFEDDDREAKRTRAT